LGAGDWRAPGDGFRRGGAHWLRVRGGHGTALPTGPLLLDGRAVLLLDGRAVRGTLHQGDLMGEADKIDQYLA
jgi:hypothetical protein